MAKTRAAVDPGATPSIPVAVDRVGAAPNDFDYQIIKRFHRAIGVEIDVNVALQAVPQALTQIINAACWVEEIFLTNITDQVQRVSICDGNGATYFLKDYPLQPHEPYHFTSEAGIQFPTDVRWQAENANAVNGSIRGMR